MTNNVDDLLLNQGDIQAPVEPNARPPGQTEALENPPPDGIESTPEPETTSESTDDYGNVVPSEDPPEEMIPKSVMRERLERKNREAEQRIAEAESRAREKLLAEMREKQSPEEDVSGDWQQELKSLIIETQKEEQSKEAQRKWQAEEQEMQAQFEVKFNKSAARYNDFEDVVMGKSITPQMAMATRGMEDPAAFIYAAAKTQPQELSRISKINDPYSQAIELGRLEERMKKARTNASQAPRPVSTIKGDVSESAPSHKNIDDLLIRDERERMKERNR